MENEQEQALDNLSEAEYDWDVASGKLYGYLEATKPRLYDQLKKAGDTKTRTKARDDRWSELGKLTGLLNEMQDAQASIKASISKINTSYVVRD